MSQKTYLAEEIIHKKREGLPLTQGEIEYFIRSHNEGNIPDYQMSALLMCIFFNGMNAKETFYLTNAMLNSGHRLPFNDPDIIDKHSTGGVGDKTSFIAGPIAAACGVKVPMIAGRGLGHTGGTVDKIESIPGLDTSIPMARLPKLLKQNNMFLIGQTEKIAPSDKKIYALRDVTATVESIALISASIMSKKIAGGAKGLVMDIKTGSGSFLKSKGRAKKLAQSMKNISKHFNHHFFAFITDMDKPLGKAIGNANEMIESIETLKGKGPKDLTELSIELAAAMIFMAKKAKTFSSAKTMAKKALKNGAALKKLKDLIILQNGDASYIDSPEKFEFAPFKTFLFSPAKGYIKKMNALEFGKAIVHLGGGRQQKEDSIDHSIGINLFKQVGDKVTQNEPLLEIIHHGSQKEMVEQIIENLKLNIKISKEKPQPTPIILAKDFFWAD